MYGDRRVDEHQLLGSKLWAGLSANSSSLLASGQFVVDEEIPTVPDVAKKGAVDLLDQLEELI
jgi:hypothetical protein